MRHWPHLTKDWRSMYQRYLDYCEEESVPPIEVADLHEVPVA
jgi:hypothetical protein